MMTSLQIALIEKIGWNNGFEYVASSDTGGVVLGSARHRTRVVVVQTDGHFRVQFTPSSPALLPELKREFTENAPGQFEAHSEQGLIDLLRRATKLAQALPHQAVEHYKLAVSAALAELPTEIKGTEVERLVRQRVGQQSFRQAQLNYWGGACAVTGIAVPAVLRASHAKPWADCESDAERLDVFNGFLLSANLDALFDRFLVSFNEMGQMLISNSLTVEDAVHLGIDGEMNLRWLAEEHHYYLDFHREKFSRFNE